MMPPHARMLELPKVSRTPASMSASFSATHNRPARARSVVTMTTLHDQVLVRTSSASSPKPPRAAASDPTREPSIVLRQPGDTGTYVDGGWWPRSLDLIAEVPPLVTAVEAAGYGEVRRISYSLTAWDGRPPRKTSMLDRIFKLGGFRSQDPAELSLVDSSGRKRMTIVVVPPGADPTVARRALTMAGMNGDRHRAAEILGLAQHSPSTHVLESGCVDETAAARWDSEGGRVMS